MYMTEFEHYVRSAIRLYEYEHPTQHTFKCSRLRMLKDGTKLMTLTYTSPYIDTKWRLLTWTSENDDIVELFFNVENMKTNKSYAGGFRQCYIKHPDEHLVAKGNDIIYQICKCLEAVAETL